MNFVSIKSTPFFEPASGRALTRFERLTYAGDENMNALVQIDVGDAMEHIINTGDRKLLTSVAFHDVNSYEVIV